MQRKEGNECVECEECEEGEECKKRAYLMHSTVMQCKAMQENCNAPQRNVRVQHWAGLDLTGLDLTGLYVRIWVDLCIHCALFPTAWPYVRAQATNVSKENLPLLHCLQGCTYSGNVQKCPTTTNHSTNKSHNPLPIISSDLSSRQTIFRSHSWSIPR